MDAVIKSRLRDLPQINEFLEIPAIKELTDAYSHDLIKVFCQEAIALKRQQIMAGAEELLEQDLLVLSVREKLTAFLQPRIQQVINGTGILLHTGLGRAPLLDEAYERALRRVRGFCDLELDLADGDRGDRQAKLEDLLTFLTGAEAAAVVNNNAAAVLLVLNTLAHRKEVIVGRGQLIEIGGSFRLPEVMRKSGARLVEVGTTNRTYLADYEQAMNARTGAVLLAHTSNYRVRGFVHEVEVGALAALCAQSHIPLIHDLGGGALIDLREWDLPHEPMAKESVAAGCSVVTFSGDKILGGPQAGILVGRMDSIARIRKNALMRALRPDKFTLALLEETLKLYLSPKELLRHHPILERLTEARQAVWDRAQRATAAIIAAGLPPDAQLEMVETRAQLGSGALPLEEFPSAALRIRRSGQEAGQLARRLRLGDPPIIGYVKKNWLYLDMKAIWPEEIDPLAASVGHSLAGDGNNKS